MIKKRARPSSSQRQLPTEEVADDDNVSLSEGERNSLRFDHEFLGVCSNLCDPFPHLLV